MIELGHLAIEVTRNCNMYCAHCLRGDPENAAASIDLLDRLFSQVSHVEHLLLTGGEPSMRSDILHSLVERAKAWGCTIGYFFVATNAKQYHAGFVDALDELYGYCRQPHRCGLSISIDQFHEKADQKALQEYRSLPYYTKTLEKGRLKPYKIVAEGRAQHNGLGNHTFSPKEFLYCYRCSGDRLQVSDTVYINALGDVLLDADLSYERQRKYSIGNLEQRDLFGLLTHRLFVCGSGHTGNFYTLRYQADAGIVDQTAYTQTLYFRHAARAFGAMQSMGRNIYHIPMNAAPEGIPDDLIIREKEVFKENDLDFLEGKRFHYETASGKKLGTVEIILRQIVPEDRDD